MPDPAASARYLAVSNATGAVIIAISASAIEGFFNLVEKRTGIDRVMAEAILHSGREIRTPEMTFMHERIS